MLYALRDANGKIISLTETAQENAEPVDLKNPDVLAFLSADGDSFTPDHYLNQSDIAIARIVEDLIQLLIERNLIIFTDLPDAAQQKLLTRKLARRLITQDHADEDTPASSSILSDDESFL